jgi:hypothetical protein
MLTDEEVSALEEQPEPPPMRPEVLDSLMEKINWRRRRSRLISSIVLGAAAAVLAVAVGILVWPGGAGQQGDITATGPMLEMTKVAPTPINATVSLTSFGWGTRIDMACTYGDWGNRDAPPQKLSMVVVGENGSQNEVATWLGLSGATALPSGNIPMPMDKINAVQLVEIGSGKVLLQKDL